MNPGLASFLTFGFIALLFRRDRLQKTGVTGAVWIPLLWLLVTSGKPVAEWTQILTGISLDGTIWKDSVEWAVLIVAGAWTLGKRGVSVSEVSRNNRFITIYLLYCLISVFWSDDLFWSLKHWMGTVGLAIMALIILTEPDPEAALTWMLKCYSFVVIPISILLIRYYPRWGREWSPWDGEVQNAGFSLDKNSLGVICMICGYFFVWHLLNILRLQRNNKRRDELLLCVALLLMVAYLFKGLHCGTALVSFAVGVIVIVLINLPIVDKSRVLTYLMAGVVLLPLEEATLGLHGEVIKWLGKDSTLTSRVPMWHDLLAFDRDPILGAGNDGFWLPDREKMFWGEYYKPQDTKPNEAHNGYLETYLNFGLVGLFLLAGWIIATFKKCQLELLRNYNIGLFRMGFLVASIFYNWTEAGYKTISPVFFMFFLIAMDYPRPELATAAKPAETVPEGAEMGFAVAKAHNSMVNNQTDVVMN